MHHLGSLDRSLATRMVKLLAKLVGPAAPNLTPKFYLLEEIDGYREQAYNQKESLQLGLLPTGKRGNLACKKYSIVAGLLVFGPYAEALQIGQYVFSRNIGQAKPMQPTNRGDSKLIKQAPGRMTHDLIIEVRSL
jgi:hypothetical protein